MPLKARNMIPEDDSRVAQIGHPAPPWLVNYADLMTELVCFFVILYALSAALNKDMQKANQEVKDMIEEGKMQGQVAMDKEGLKITLEEQKDQVFFMSGRAELTDDMQKALEHIVPVLEIAAVVLLLFGRARLITVDVRRRSSGLALLGRLGPLLSRHGLGRHGEDNVDANNRQRYNLEGFRADVGQMR